MLCISRVLSWHRWFTAVSRQEDCPWHRYEWRGTGVGMGLDLCFSSLAHTRNQGQSHSFDQWFTDNGCQCQSWVLNLRIGKESFQYIPYRNNTLFKKPATTQRGEQCFFCDGTKWSFVLNAAPDSYVRGGRFQQVLSTPATSLWKSSWWTTGMKGNVS